MYLCGVTKRYVVRNLYEEEDEDEWRREKQTEREGDSPVDHLSQTFPKRKPIGEANATHFKRAFGFFRFYTYTVCLSLSLSLYSIPVLYTLYNKTIMGVFDSHIKKNSIFLKKVVK